MRQTVVLCNLVARRLVLIEIVFPVKPAHSLDIAVEGNGGA